MAFTLKIPARVMTATFPDLLSMMAALKSRTVFHNATQRNSNRIMVDVLEHATARLRPVMEPDHTIALADALVRAGVEWKELIWSTPVLQAGCEVKILGKRFVWVSART